MGFDDVLSFFGVAYIPSALAFAGLWLSMRRRARSAERRLDALLGAPARTAPYGGNEQLEATVDALAGEVQRLTEGQRFLTKLLEQQAPSHRTAPRVVTPH